MDTNRLRYFCTVSNTGNIHRASELLGISPAALSKAIKTLESEIGLKLTSPSGRGIVITAEGRSFAQRAAVLLAELEQLRQSAKQSAVKKRIRMGSFEVFTTHCLGPLLRDLGDLGELDLILHELVPGRLEEALLADHLDLGVTYLPIPTPGLDFMKVTSITMGVYGLPSLLHRKAIAEIPFVVPATPLSGAPSKVVGLDGWPDNLVRREIKYRVSLMESALELCRFGMAAAFLPKFIVDLHNAKTREPYQLQPYVGALPLQSKYIFQPVYLVKRKGDAETQAMKRIAKALRIVCRA